MKLFARNEDVDLYNYKKLMAMDGELKVFEAEDSGDEQDLRKILAPKRLGLKVNAPVMLLRNLNGRHVNGLRGKVVKINNDSIEMNFKTFRNSETVRIEKFCFTRYDPVKHTCIASRTQFPLKLAFAMTMHKSQGMSIRFVEVNCKKATFPGQVGVAVGRAQTSEGLRVVNYSPGLCKEHPTYVQDFYEIFSMKNVTRMTLIKFILVVVETTSVLKTKLYAQPTAVELDSDSEMDDLIENVEQIENAHHSYYRINEVDVSDCETDLQYSFNDYKDTPTEAKARNALDTILSKREKLSLWYGKQCSTIANIYEKCCPFEPNFIQFQQYKVSLDYTQSINSVTEVEISRHLFSSVMISIQEKVPKDKAATVEATEETRSVFPSIESTISAPGKGKIRYVGGYCVAKVRYRLCKTMRNCFFVPGMTPEINKLQEQINILDDMTISSSDILTNLLYEDTLEETHRKQNTAEGLTNICDNVFEYFEMVEKVLRTLLTLKTLSENRKHLYKYAL